MLKFKVIAADPPWSFRLYSNEGLTKAPQRHYDCMKLADIKALPVADAADPSGCVLFLWATNPMLPEALDVIRDWDFRYVSKIEWVKMVKDGSKPSMGTGYRVRSSTEPLLIAVRGKGVYCPTPAERLPGVILAPRLRHSEKPARSYDFFEQYPGPRLELFARSVRPGWTALGNEIDDQDIRDSLPALIPQLALSMETEAGVGGRTISGVY